jgi:DNA-binding transcriptional ArsR family regulator
MRTQDRKLYRMRAGILRAAGHPLRLAMLDRLQAGEQCVQALAAQVGAGRSNVSRHLGVLLKAGLVDCRKEGLNQIYSIRTPCVMRLVGCATEVLRRQASEQAAVLDRL